MKYLLLATGLCTIVLWGNVAFSQEAQGLIQDNIDVENQSEFISTHKKLTDRQRHTFVRQEKVKPESLEKKYADFKTWLAHKTGLTYTLDVSFLAQRGAPNGKGTPWQSQYYGTANWDMFNSESIGSGSAQIAYTAVRYWGANANDVANRMGIISSFNDYMSSANYFNQLSYTHQFVGKMDWLSATVGQFPMYNFDGSAYDSNQQINFLNYALSQNGSSAYPTASLGAFVTVTPNEFVNFTAGFQDAHMISGNRISSRNFGKKKYTAFASLSYTPKVSSLGDGEYSILVYNQPSVPEQPGTSRGWSLNFSQNIGRQWSVFARINGASHSPESIEQSYVFGAVYNNPFHRNSLDQIGFAGAINKLNQSVNGNGTRAVESVLEAYWSVGISNFMILTPDIQFYINPGAHSDVRTATVASVRATLMF